MRLGQGTARPGVRERRAGGNRGQANEREITALWVLAGIAVLGLSVLWWRQQRSPLAVYGQPALAQQAAWDAQLADARAVDVNTAGVAELERLPGVGPALAARIVAYRESRGRFRRVEELEAVQGLGPATVEKLKPYLRIN